MTLFCSSKRADPTRTRSDKNHRNRNYNDHHHHYYFVKARGQCDDNKDKREWQRMATELLKNSGEPACIKMSLQKFLKKDYKVLDWKSLK